MFHIQLTLQCTDLSLCQISCLYHWMHNSMINLTHFLNRRAAAILKMAATAMRDRIHVGSTSRSLHNVLTCLCARFHACITKCTIPSYPSVNPSHYTIIYLWMNLSQILQLSSNCFTVFNVIVIVSMMNTFSQVLSGRHCCVDSVISISWVIIN